MKCGGKIMLSYLFIFIIVLLNEIKGFASKRLSAKAKSIRDNIELSAVRNGFCVLVGAFSILTLGNSDFTMPPLGLFISIISGALTTVSYMTWVMALRGEAFMLASAVNNSNFIISAAAGILFFGEVPSVCKVVSCLLICVGIYFMMRYRINIIGIPKRRDILILVIMFVTGGLSSVVQKWFVTALPGESVSCFTFYSFFTATLILLVSEGALLLFGEKSSDIKEKKSNLRSYFFWAFIMGICLYGVSVLQTTAAAQLDAIVLYPLQNGLTMAASMLMAWIFFKEKPNRNSIIGALFVLSALVLSRF